MCSRWVAPVHNIIPFSSVDGPGNRCAIFFQGCGFHCKYCHNPETIRLCDNCGSCIETCPKKALTMEAGVIRWSREKCCGCEMCMNICPHNSSPRVRMMSVEDVMGEVVPLLPFISGITVSGGECTRQHMFLEELFKEVHRHGRTAFADTNGQRSFRNMSGLMEQMDKAMLDVKSCDEKEHQMLTGASCSMVLDNMEYLAQAHKLYEIRTVIVPGLLDNERTVKYVSSFLKSYPEIRYKLIAYRPYGVRPELDVIPPDKGYMEELEKLAYLGGAGQVIIT